MSLGERERTPEEIARMNKEIRQVYTSIGRFVVEFERISHEMRTAIIFILQSSGLRHQPHARILAASLGSRSLLDSFAAVVLETIDRKCNAAYLVKKLVADISKLSDQRNIIIHSTWWVGYGNDQTEHWDEAIGEKESTSRKHGLNYSSEVRKPAHFDDLALRAIQLSVACRIVYSNLIRRDGSIEILERELDQILNGDLSKFDPPIALRGTDTAHG